MYREPAAAPCQICEDNPVAATCACCRKDVCKRHLAPDSTRGWCKRCEDAFYAYDHRRNLRGSGKYMFGYVAAILAPLVGAIAWPPLFVLAIVATVAGGPVMMRKFRRDNVRLFIAATQRDGVPLALPRASGTELGAGDYAEVRRNGDD